MQFASLMLLITVGTQKGYLLARSAAFEVHMVMPDGVTLPAEDMLVVARSTSGAAASGLTDAKGQVSLPDLPLGKIKVSFGPPNCALKSQDIILDESFQPILLSVQPTAMLRVQVTLPSPSGHAPVPLAGAYVSVRSNHSQAAVAYVTDGSGSASACVEVGAEYEVRASYDGMVTTVVHGLKVAQGDKLDVPIVLLPMRAEK